MKDVLVLFLGWLNDIHNAVFNWRLATLEDWLVWVIIGAVLLLYLGALILSRNVQNFARQNVSRMRRGLLGVSESATLIGLVIAALAIVTNLVGNSDVSKTFTVDALKAVIICLTGSAIFFFFGFFFTRFNRWLYVYLSEACSSSGWYSLTWSLFALLEILLPHRAWRFAMLAAPAAVIFYTFGTLKEMMRSRSTVPLKGDVMTLTWDFCSVPRHGWYIDQEGCPYCVKSTDN